MTRISILSGLLVALIACGGEKSAESPAEAPAEASTTEGAVAPVEVAPVEVAPAAAAPAAPAEKAPAAAPAKPVDPVATPNSSPRPGMGGNGPKVKIDSSPGGGAGTTTKSRPH